MEERDVNEHRSASSETTSPAVFSPIRTGRDSTDGENPEPNDIVNEHSLLRRLSTKSSRGGAAGDKDEEWAEIQRLMSRMFGHQRQEQSEEEKTRHVGVVWKNLTVKGVGLGAALQPSVGDVFLGLPRMLKGIFTRGRKGAGKSAPVKTILNDFTVSASSSSSAYHYHHVSNFLGMCTPGRDAACSRSTRFRMLDLSKSHWQPASRI